MKSYLKTVKPWDFIVVLSLILLSFLPIIVFSYVQAGKITESSVNVAVISVDNKEVRKVVLTDHHTHDIFDIHSEDGTNTIEVKDGQIRIMAADCLDQICVRTGFISKPGETIVCLPHKVLIEIQTEDGTADDELIISS